MSLKDIFASVTGNEDADLDASTVVATAEEAAEAIVDKEIAEAEADIAEHDKDIAQHETAIEALEEKVEELEECVEGLESMIGGSTPFNAGLFAHQFKQGSKIVGKFGVDVEVQGAESFADASTANLAAYAGIEAMKETAAKVGGAIKKFFVDLYNSFINAFIGLFNKLKGLKAKAGTTKAAASSAEHVKASVDLPKSASLLDPDGNGNKVIDALIAVSGRVSGELGGLGLAREGDSASATHKVAEAFEGAGTRTVEGRDENNETIVVKTKGGAEIRVVAPLKDGGIGKSAVTVKLGDAGKSEKITKVHLVDLCNKVASNADRLQNAKLSKSALTTQRDKVIGTLEKNSVPKADRNDTDKAELKSTTVAIKAAHTAGLKYGKAAMSIGAEVLAAQLSFVKAHLGDKEEEPAKK